MDQPLPEGSEGQPNPSQPASGPNSPDVSTLQTEIAELKATVRSLQSGKDKAVAETNKRLNQFEKFAQYLQAAGGDPARAQREMLLDQMLEERGSSQNAPSAPAGQDRPVSDSVDTETLRAMGFDANDPAVVQLLAAGYKAADFAKLALTRGAQPQANPSPSTIQPMGQTQGRPTVTGDDAKALRAAYEKERDATVRPGDVDALFNLQTKFREKGLQI